MKIEKTNIEKLTWKYPEFGLFEATIVNGELANFRCHENGSLAEFYNGLSNSNPEFLRCVLEATTQLLEHLDKDKIPF